MCYPRSSGSSPNQNSRRQWIDQMTQFPQQLFSPRISWKREDTCSELHSQRLVQWKKHPEVKSIALGIMVHLQSVVTHTFSVPLLMSLTKGSYLYLIRYQCMETMDYLDTGGCRRIQDTASRALFYFIIEGSLSLCTVTVDSRCPSLVYKLGTLFLAC